MELITAKARVINVACGIGQLVAAAAVIMAGWFVTTLCCLLMLRSEAAVETRAVWNS